MSSICKSFESNAWRSDLCSHCFQSKEEHGQSAAAAAASTTADGSSSSLGSRYQSVLNNTRSSYRTTSASTNPTTTTVTASQQQQQPVTNNKLVGVHIIPTVVSILKSERPRIRINRKTVNFPEEDETVAAVIGYGGQESFEDDDDAYDYGSTDDVADGNNEEEDDSPFTEEERQIYNQTQKNTSFNSVSRNLLVAEVATFKSHGISSTPTTTSSAPLVTIRPFGQSDTPSRPSPTAKKSLITDNPKINLVSPMRNGQVLTVAPTTTTTTVEIKNRENLMTPPPPMSLDSLNESEPSTEKFTSFTEPEAKSTAAKSTTTTAIIPTPPTSNRSSTLSRKPPVWKEKPRIPIKPQSVVTIQQQQQQQQVEAPGTKQLKAQTTLDCLPGQISVRFVHLSQDPVTNTNETTMDNNDVPSLIPPTGRPSSPIKRPSIVEPEVPISAPVPKVAEYSRPSASPPQIEINNNPTLPAVDYEPKSVPIVDPSTNNSTRGLTRSAFEALRTSLAGSLELSRMYGSAQQPQRQSGREAATTKRPAPPTPLETHEDLNDPQPVASEPIGCAVAASALEEEESIVVPVIINSSRPPLAERALSASPVYRNRNSSSSVCQSPEGSGHFSDVPLSDEEKKPPQPRSISLNRAVERTDSHLQAKSPSIRKMIKDRTTKLLFNMADGSVVKCGSSRMSRSERFAAEQQQQQQTSNGGSSSKKTASSKAASRFLMVRKFLGLKKDQTANGGGGGGQTVQDMNQEQQPPVVKIRPEIVHPIDFHPVGQVQVVAGKPDSVTFCDPILDSVTAAAAAAAAAVSSSASDSLSSQPSSLASSHNSSLKSSFSAGRPRPPPPPRQQSVDQQQVPKPSRPPPPRTSLEPAAAPSEYANLGDVRSGRVSPKKPERVNSIRAKEAITGGLHYDSVSVQAAAPTVKSDEDGYIVPMRIKSTPSFSAGSGNGQRHSLSSFMAPAVGSSDSSASSTQSSSNRRASTYAKPSPSRHSRLDLHVKLEDHYGTVTGANFQALAQLLEQATSKRPLEQHFHELRREVNGPLRWNAFGGNGDQDVVLLRTGSLTVLESRWRGHDLLLSVYPLSRQESVDNKAPFAQPAVANFQDQVPVPFVPIPAVSKAGVEVFPPGQVATLKQLPHLVAMEMEETERLQQSLCVVLQICRAVEWQQQQQQQNSALRIQPEEIVFYREDNRDAYRLFWLTGSGVEERSVRDILSTSVRLLAPLLTVQQTDKLYSLIQQRADKVIAYLEFALFGPSDELMDSDPEPLDTFQRWLDVERASVLNELIRSQGLWRVKLSILEEFRLSFLVSTSPQRLLDTSHI